MKLFAAAAVSAAMLFAAPATATAAKPVTVTITHVQCVDNCDEHGLEGVGQGTADLFARVFIDGVRQPDTGFEDDNASRDPNWVITAQVPDDREHVPVAIQLWDDDDPGEDLGDASPNSGDNNLDLDLDYHSGQWSSPDGAQYRVTGGNVAQACSVGGGGDEPRVQVCFRIDTAESGDFDGDGIPDGVELYGMPTGGVGSTLAPIANMPMDPCRKTIALQIDWMKGDDKHTHKPMPEAVTDAVAAMDAAPVLASTGCPYGGYPKKSTGVNLVIDLAHEIDEKPVFTLDDLVALRDAGNLTPARRPYMQYVVFAHDQATGSSSSGLCCRDNRDFIVTLGSWANNVGTFRDQSGSILHELGHALGLGHGGDSDVNYKPNYLSVMNYTFDPLGIPDPTIAANVDTDKNGTLDQSRRLDYSRSALASLDETSLQEPLGIQDGTDQTLFWDASYVLRTGAGTGPINWNQAGGSAETVKADVNADYCVDAGADKGLNSSAAGDDTIRNNVILSGPNFICETAVAGDDTQYTAPGTNVLSVLTGFNDWANIKYRGALSPTAGGADGGHPSRPDITFETAQRIEAATAAQYAPDLVVSKSVDKPDAAAGETLNYTVTTKNAGTGDAKAVEVRDTMPTGSVTTWTPGLLAAGATDTRTPAYAVPCATADGTKVVNAASARATNLLNNPEVDVTNNAASVTSTVHAPRLTLSDTATAQANPGGAIVYRLAYANTGSGGASSVTLTASVPADVYYSPALDLATTGPRPTSVLRNPDGTTTLSWTLGALAGGGAGAIEFTARPSLLFAGAAVSSSARVTYTNPGNCVYAPVNASSTTSMVAVPPTRNPVGHGYWKTHSAEWTAEMLARIQATDQRFDGIDLSLPDGRLSAAEVTTTLGATGPQPSPVRFHLLALYFDLATRRIAPSTVIKSATATKLGTGTVRAAALYAAATLALPLAANKARYDDVTTVLDELVNGRSEVY